MEILYIVQKTAKTYAANKIEIKDNMLTRCSHTKGRRLSSIQQASRSYQTYEGFLSRYSEISSPNSPRPGYRKPEFVWDEKQGLWLIKRGQTVFLWYFFSLTRRGETISLLKGSPEILLSFRCQPLFYLHNLVLNIFWDWVEISFELFLTNV